MESILSALIAGAVTLIGVLIANSRSQAVTDTKAGRTDPRGARAQQFRPPRAHSGRADEGGQPPHCRP